MSELNKYYLREGRLELSILDDMEEEVESGNDKQPSIKNGESRVKLTEDIYNTLQAMGKFLTKKEPKETLNENATPKSIEEHTIPEEPLGEEVAPLYWNQIRGYSKHKVNLQAKELEQVVRSMYEEVAKQVEDFDLPHKTKIVEKESSRVVAKDTVQDEIKNSANVLNKIERRIVESTAIEAASTKQLTIFEEDDERELEQSAIDDLMSLYFGESTPKDDRIKQIKHYIDKQISLINNCE